MFLPCLILLIKNLKSVDFLTSALSVLVIFLSFCYNFSQPRRLSSRKMTLIPPGALKPDLTMTNDHCQAFTGKKMTRQTRNKREISAKLARKNREIGANSTRIWLFLITKSNDFSKIS
jgi:hypothetical protein